MESEIWEQEDRGIRIREIIEDLADDLINIPKSEKDVFLRTKIREILDEKKFIE